MRERSLVLFTLLAQTACGALVGLAGMQVLGDSDVLGPLSFIVVGALLLVATSISTLHLGQPRHAPYAMLNLRRSWLSREILGLGVTGGLVALGALVGLLAEPAASFDARTLIGVLAAIAGLFLVATMIGLYSVRTITEWRPPATALRFFGSTLRLGAIGAGVLAAVAGWPDAVMTWAGAWLILLLLVGLGQEAALHRQPSPPATSSVGALLQRPPAAPSVEDPLSWRLVGGVLVAGAGAVMLSMGLPPAALVLLAVSTVLSVPPEMRARERFYELAPTQGRLLPRPAAH